MMKKVVIIFFIIKGIVRFEFIPRGHLCEALRRKRPELCPNNWFLHHDSAPAHKVLSLSGSFWPKNLLLKWNTHPLPLIWL
jgi:hypothetical protein